MHDTGPSNTRAEGAFARLRHEWRPTLRLALPAVAAELGWMGMGAVDTLMVGRISPEAIGAVGLGSALFLVPATWAEAGILWAGTAAAVILHDAFGPYPTAAEWLAGSSRAIVWCVYLPALIMILRRPNVFPGPPLAEPASAVSLSRRSESEAP